MGFQFLRDRLNDVGAMRQKGLGQIGDVDQTGVDNRKSQLLEGWLRGWVLTVAVILQAKIRGEFAHHSGCVLYGVFQVCDLVDGLLYKPECLLFGHTTIGLKRRGRRKVRVNTHAVEVDVSVSGVSGRLDRCGRDFLIGLIAK